MHTEYVYLPSHAHIFTLIFTNAQITIICFMIEQ